MTLPASLLSAAALTEAELASLSRVNFMFFGSTGLFQVGPEPDPVHHPPTTRPG